MRAKHMIWWTMLALILAAAVGARGGGEKDKWAKLKAKLGLTDAQVSQLESKLDALKAQGEVAEHSSRELREEIERAEKNGDQQTVTAKREGLETLQREWREKNRAVWRSVLTKEQMEKYEQMTSADNESREREEKERNEKKKK